LPTESTGREALIPIPYRSFANAASTLQISLKNRRLGGLSSVPTGEKNARIGGRIRYLFAGGVSHEDDRPLRRR
jgi:hypothetical protein